MATRRRRSLSRHRERLASGPLRQQRPNVLGRPQRAHARRVLPHASPKHLPRRLQNRPRAHPHGPASPPHLLHAARRPLRLGLRHLRPRIPRNPPPNQKILIRILLLLFFFFLT